MSLIDKYNQAKMDISILLPFYCSEGLKGEWEEGGGEKGGKKVSLNFQ